MIQHGANQYHVQSQAEPRDAEPWICTVRGRLRRGKQAKGALAVIGDRVRCEVTAAAERKAAIEEVLPRDNRVSRPAPSGHNRRPREQVVVANLDRLWVTVSVSQPPLNLRFVDRILAASRFQGVPAGIIWNKVDLVDELEYPGGLEALQQVYGDLEYPMRITSVISGVGLDDLREDLSEGTMAFVGLSGVGKSSLLTAIQPGLGIRVASVGERSGHGRHTTSSSHLYLLDAGGYVADTPGMREFGLWGMFQSDLSDGFVEMQKLAVDCRFRDCLHRTEPKCVVREAVGTIVAEGRYESYLALLDELPQDDLERDGIIRAPKH